ncbi:MAG: Hpt domain-containing protein [Clostridiales Family XIII bacterium]|jgi:HPt (histidine-containing phosphotransfer) domain-containing protein|nr:Hpt domain-containing protein [Clostridiales Family XIII bacterium]
MSELLDLIKASAQYPADFEEYVDVDSGLRRVAGNKKIYIKIMKSFLDSAEFENLRNNLSSNDILAAAATAHGLKGMAGNLSLTKLYQQTVDLEGQLKQGVYDPAAGASFYGLADKSKEYIRVLLAAIDTE